MAGDGYQMNAVDEAQKRRTQGVFWPVMVVVLGVALTWIIATSHFGPDYLPRQTFAGCYVSAKGDPLELEPTGLLRSRGSTVGAFKVLAPVGGKHGPLISAAGVNLRVTGTNVYFEPGRDGYFWDVSDRALQVVFPPDNSVLFQRVSGTHCR